MRILGIETSCDETSVAVVEEGWRVRSNLVHSQIAQHRPYGGVVPEIASRSHVERLPLLILEGVQVAGCSFTDLDAVAVTRGPGLASSLLVGLTAANALGARLGIPVLGMNHLQAHLYSILLEQPPQETAAWFPLLALLVSGGHTCLVEMASPHEFKLLGQTLDDAAGEALDKGASLLGLGYPGGPAIQKAALGGDANRVRFPRGLQGGRHEGLNFSFSGVKTALRYYVKDHPVADDAELRRDVTASYQHAVVDALVQRVDEALKTTSVRGLACAGGVARNTLLRERLADVAVQHGVALHLAAPDHCTDNAAMIAGLAGSGMAVTPGPVREIDPNLAVDTPFEYRAN